MGKMKLSVADGTPGVSAVMLGASALVGEDGAFHVRGLVGTRFVRVTGLPTGWALESVRANGIDVTDEGIEILENLDGVEIHVTATATQISGVVTDADGKLAPEAAVIIFPEARERRVGPMNRFLTTVRASTDGSFTVRALPPATYLAMAVPAVVDGEWAEPDQLERMAARAGSRWRRESRRPSPCASKAHRRDDASPRPDREPHAHLGCSCTVGSAV